MFLPYHQHWHFWPIRREWKVLRLLSNLDGRFLEAPTLHHRIFWGSGQVCRLLIFIHEFLKFKLQKLSLFDVLVLIESK